MSVQVTEDTSQEAPESGKSGHSSFTLEWLYEIGSGAIILTLAWLIGHALDLEIEKAELIVGPILLAWCAAKGWRSPGLFWAAQPTIRTFVKRLFVATFILLGVPLLFFGSLYGCYVLFQDRVLPTYEICILVLALVLGAGAILVNWQHTFRATLSFLELAEVKASDKARFFTYWLVALILLFLALRPEEPSFNELCDFAWSSLKKMDIVTLPEETMVTGAFRRCQVTRDGDVFLLASLPRREIAQSAQTSSFPTVRRNFRCITLNWVIRTPEKKLAGNRSLKL